MYYYIRDEGRCFTDKKGRGVVEQYIGQVWEMEMFSTPNPASGQLVYRLVEALPTATASVEPGWRRVVPLTLTVACVNGWGRASNVTAMVGTA